MGLILIVDDEPGIRDILSTFLGESGYSTKVVTNGKEALEFLENGHDLDLVITDIRMPVTSGNELAKHIRSSQNATLPVIGITGSNWDFDAKLFDTILEKPFKLTDLVSEIARLLG